MTNYIISGFIALALSIGGWFGLQQIKDSNLLSFGDVRVFTVPQGGTGAATLTGCLEGNGTSAITGTGSDCGSGGGGGGGTFSTSTVAGNTSLLINYPNNATDVVLIGSTAGTSTAEYFFDPNIQSARIGNSNTASTTLLGNLFLPTVGQGFLYGGTNGLIQKIASSSIALSWFNNDSGFLTSATSAFEIATGTIAVPQLAYFTKTSGKTTLGSVATTTLAGTGAISISNSPVVIGASGAVVSCATSDTNTTGCLTDTDWDTFNNKQATITAGDALTLTGTDIDFDGGTAPGGSLGGTWASPTIDDLFILNTGDIGTGSYTLPTLTWNYGSSTIYSSFLTASTTNFSFGGVFGDQWSDFCTAITGGAGLCDGSDDGAGGSSSDPFTHSTIHLPTSATTTKLGIGTTTPYYSLTVASSTGPQIALSDTGGLSQWTFRNAGGNLYLSTTTVAGTATTSTSALTINGSGNPSLTISTTTAGCATFASTGELYSLGSACGTSNPQTFPDFSYNQTLGFGVTGASTSTVVKFTQGIQASGTSQFNNSTTTLATIVTGWFTNLFIGAVDIAEYIADTAGAMFTGNTETGITVTYQDADNTVDVVCNTADTSTFGCLTDTDWDTFNNKQATVGVTFPITLSGTTIGFGGLSTSSTPTISHLPYFSGVNTFASVATTTLTASSPLSLSNPVAKVGGSNSVLTIDTSGAWSGSAGSVANSLTNGSTLNGSSFNGSSAISDWDINLANANTWTVNQTFNYSSSTIYSSFLTASTTNLTGGLITGFGLSDCDADAQTLSWDSTTSTFGCGDDDNSGGAGSSAFEIATTSGIGVSQLAYFNKTSGMTTLASVATTTLTLSGFPANVPSTLGSLVGGSNTTWTWWGLSTTSQPASSNVLVSNGGAGVYGVATGTVSGSGGVTVTAGRSAIGGALTITCTAADTNNTGCLSDTDWDTFNGKQAIILTTWPIIKTGATLSFGWATTSQPSSSNLFVSNGTNGFYGVATSTLSASAPLTGSFTQIGSGGSLGCTNASSGVTGCLTGTDWTTFNSKLGSYDAWTHATAGLSATTSALAVSTSTNPSLYPLTAFSSTLPQLALSAGAGIAQWTMRNAGGNLYFSTTTVAGTATSSPAALTINNSGYGVFLGATTSNSQVTGLAVAGTGAWSGLASESGAGDVMCVKSDGSIVLDSSPTTACSGASSRTVKNTIKTLDADRSLEAILSMNPVSYIYNKSYKPNDQTTHLGFIAEEVDNIDSRLVENGEIKGLKYVEFIPLTVGAIQELNQKIDNITGEAKKSATDNWQWIVIGILIGWNLYLTLRRR